MKKIVALLLLLITACVFTAASAQSLEIYREDSLFYIEITPPSGARVTDSSTNESFSMTELAYITAGNPSVVITAAPDEVYIGQSLSDLSAEEVALIISEVTVEMADPAVDIRETPGGYEYIVANESTAVNDTCDTVMLVNGYFIMVHVYYEDFSELSETDMEIGPSIVDTINFVGNTNT